jgi:branched-chain amino acid transport system substrate-binding protein
MEEGVLMVSAAASNPRLTDEAKDLVFRVYGRDDQQGAFDADYILKHFRGKKIALLNDQSAWGVGLTDAIKKNINQSGVVEVLSDSFSTGGKDYSFLVSKLKQARADVLFLAAFPTEAGLITRQLKEQDTHIQVIGGDALTTDEFWKIAGPTAEGVLMSFTSDPRKFTEAQVVVDEFRNSGFEPDGVTLYTYGAIQVIAEGIKRAGKTNTQKIATALRQGPIYTVLGDLSFDSKGDVPKRSYVMYRWHDGKYAEAEQ